MLPCPACKSVLVRTTAGGVDHWACPGCHGKAVTLGRMRQAFPPEFVQRVRAATDVGGWVGRRRCPRCASSMVARRIPHGGAKYALDDCQKCRLVWFDRGEHEAAEGTAPAPPPPKPEDDVSGRPRRWSSGMTGDDITLERDRPGGLWQGVAPFLDIPMTENEVEGTSTWASSALWLAIAVAGGAALLFGGNHVVRDWGLVPGDPFRHGGLDFVTSVLLHANLLHLASNLYFLLMLGPDVEEELRPAKYLLLFALAALAGKLLYVACAAPSRVPSVGASGGISGLLAYWALAFPHARVYVRVMRLQDLATVSFTSRTWAGIWVGLQVVGALLHAPGTGGVNHLAHLGGAAVGAAFWLLGPDGPWALAGRGATIGLSRRAS